MRALIEEFGGSIIVGIVWSGVLAAVARMFMMVTQGNI